MTQLNVGNAEQDVCCASCGASSQAQTALAIACSLNASEFEGRVESIRALAIAAPVAALDAADGLFANFAPELAREAA